MRLHLAALALLALKGLIGWNFSAVWVLMAINGLMAIRAAENRSPAPPRVFLETSIASTLVAALSFQE